MFVMNKKFLTLLKKGHLSKVYCSGRKADYRKVQGGQYLSLRCSLNYCTELGAGHLFAHMSMECFAIENTVHISEKCIRNYEFSEWGKEHRDVTLLLHIQVPELNPLLYIATRITEFWSGIPGLL